MADWEDEEYEIEVQKPATTDAWDGEDEDDDIKDNWDDEEEEKPAGAPVKAEKKKPLKERIAEREAKRKAEKEEMLRKEEEARKQMTPEEIQQEKERMKLQEEEEQLMLAQELMGVKIAPSSGIDAMKPKTTEEFTNFAKALKEKITESQSHPAYDKFLEELFRDICASMNSDSIKKIGTSLNTLANEKQKLEKAALGGKKKKKTPQIKQVRENDMDEGEFDEFDDFM